MEVEVCRCMIVFGSEEERCRMEERFLGLFGIVSVRGDESGGSRALVRSLEGEEVVVVRGVGWYLVWVRHRDMVVVELLSVVESESRAEEMGEQVKAALVDRLRAGDCVVLTL